MEYATKNLENDHVSILKLIDVMERMTTKTPIIEDLEEVVDLIRNFADGLHHAKEESLLFPRMAERGFSMTQGPIAVMLSDHAQGRNFVKGMAENIGLLKNGDSFAIKAIYENMLGYGELLTNHIAKENNILFRMADTALSTADHQSLVTQFAEIENQIVSNNSKEGYLARIEKLALKYLEG
ncbi:MAG: hemerythrin domain-containing protein [Mariniphaga sp.]